MKIYYEDSAVQIYNTDCREVLADLPIADCVITDPPYSNATHDGARSKTNGPNSREGDAFTRKTVNFASIDVSDLRRIFGLCKFNRWLISFLDYHYVIDLETVPPPGVRFVRFAIWAKGTTLGDDDGFIGNSAPQFSGDRPGMGWEAIGVLHKDGGKMQWNGGGRNGVFFEKKVQSEHPTAKPLKLMARLVELFTNPNELILDPFMGEGTTLRAAKDLHRRAIGVEIDERWCEVAANKMQQDVLPFAGPSATDDPAIIDAEYREVGEDESIMSLVEAPPEDDGGALG
jgi:site-specific DNA-methyltransferase (adenine-specific)